jgi:hypothetical protein
MAIAKEDIKHREHYWVRDRSDGEILVAMAWFEPKYQQVPILFQCARESELGTVDDFDIIARIEPPEGM